MLGKSLKIITNICSLSMMSKTGTTKKALQGLKAKQVGRNRNIVASDAEDIAHMTAKGLNESEACAILGLDRTRWYEWKDRHKTEYAETFTRIKGNRVRNLLSEIEAASEGDA